MFSVSKISGFFEPKLLMNWRTLDAILSTKIVAGTFIWLTIVPILAKFLAKVPSEVTVSFSGASIPLTMELPFTWYSLYFAALAFATSRCVYLVYCPEFVRKFRHASDAATAGYTIQKLRDDCKSYFLRLKADEPLPLDNSLQRLVTQWKCLHFKEHGIEDLKDGRLWAELVIENKASTGFIDPKYIAGLTELAEFKGDEKGNYALKSANNRSKMISVPKEQLFKTLFWDFERYLLGTALVARWFASLLILAGSLCLLSVFIQSFFWVIS